jgi:outer membrane phospholipase A
MLKLFKIPVAKSLPFKSPRLKKKKKLKIRSDCDCSDRHQLTNIWLLQERAAFKAKQQQCYDSRDYNSRLLLSHHQLPSYLQPLHHNDFPEQAGLPPKSQLGLLIRSSPDLCPPFLSR